MRKKIGVAMVIVFLFANTVILANDNINVNVTYDSLTEAWVVTGTVKSEKANLPLTLRVTNPQGEFFYGNQIVVPPDNFNSILGFSFAPIYIGADFAGGDYTFTVESFHLGASCSVAHYHIGVDMIFDSLQKIAAAIKAKNESGLISEIKNNAQTMSLSTATLNELKAKGLSTFAQAMFLYDLKLPNNIFSLEDMERIKEIAILFRNGYMDALAAATYSEIESAEDLQAWLASNTLYYKLDLDDPGTLVDESKLFEYVTDMKESSVLTDRIKKRASLLTIDTIKSSLFEDALLATIYSKHYSEARTVIETFRPLFDVNWSAYEKLSPTNQGIVYERMSGKNYDTYKKAAQDFDNIVASLSESSKGHVGGPGGGGRSTGTFVQSLMPSDERAIPEVSEKTDGFSDLESVDWAKEAILYLKDLNIIQGKSDNLFFPDDHVTRAEFVKILVLAFNIQPIGGASDFADVSETDWFNPYARAAKTNGLIWGDDDNNFHPNDPITRQDMAVMLYRSLKIANLQIGSIRFIDTDEISEYARDAVSYFSNNGIIKGVEGNRFAPHDAATRAQAAVIIYRIINIEF